METGVAGKKKGRIEINYFNKFGGKTLGLKMGAIGEELKPINVENVFHLIER